MVKDSHHLLTSASKRNCVGFEVPVGTAVTICSAERLLDSIDVPVVVSDDDTVERVVEPVVDL